MRCLCYHCCRYEKSHHILLHVLFTIGDYSTESLEPDCRLKDYMRSDCRALLSPILLKIRLNEKNLRETVFRHTPCNYLHILKITPQMLGCIF
jgi:hypothetical protein